MQNTQIPWHTAEFTSGGANGVVEEGAEGINHRVSGVKLNSEGKKPLSLLQSRSKMLWRVRRQPGGIGCRQGRCRARGDRWPGSGKSLGFARVGWD